MKRVLVYPWGTEIRPEIYRSLRYSTHYEVYGGSYSYDHGRFAYEENSSEKKNFCSAAPPSVTNSSQMQMRCFEGDGGNGKANGVALKGLLSHLTASVCQGKTFLYGVGDSDIAIGNAYQYTASLTE